MIDGCEIQKPNDDGKDEKLKLSCTLSLEMTELNFSFPPIGFAMEIEWNRYELAFSDYVKN